jgi:hypothetical protein
VRAAPSLAHLSPGKFRPDDLLKVSVGFSRDGGTVVDLAAAGAEKSGEIGQGTTTLHVDGNDARQVTADVRWCFCNTIFG